MLKITKGLKKKKKSKRKHKKDEELFKPEELEAYRREHQLQQQTVEGINETDEQSGSGEPSKNTENDEWKKFNALTSGVDSILKKTQSDLTRIKSTSFFQKKPVPSELPPEPEQIKDPEKWIGFDESKKAGVVKTAAENKTATEEIVADGVVHISESETESDDDQDDIFDTSYVDVVASGEIKLAYIPESPTEKTDDFDPFDTSAAEKIIRGPEVSKKGKKLVSIGPAVEVLTGRIDHVGVSIKKSPRRGPINRDLLLDTLDNNGNNITDDVTPTSAVEEKPTKSLLDDDDPIPISEPINLSKSLVTVLPKPIVETTTPCGVVNDKTTDILKELDPIAAKTDISDEFDDEFASLAVESLSKKVEPITEVPEIKAQIEEVTAWNAFDESKNDNFDPRAEERKSSTVNINVTDPEGLSESLDHVDEDNLTSLKPIHRDLLGGSTTDLTKLENKPITPLEIKEEDSLSYSDPFDTSIVDQIAPGKVELKFIEAELLGDTHQQQPEIHRSLSDPDFDPRSGEEPIEISAVLDSAPVQIAGPPTVNPVPAPAPPASIGRRFSETFDESPEDPFDTSFVAYVAPGKEELKLIESELAELEEPPAGPTIIKTILNEEKKTRPESLPFELETKNSVDLLVVEDDVNIKVLTPATEKLDLEFELTYTDPFDTSAASNILPGKAELKLLENELMSIETTIQPKPVLDINKIIKPKQQEVKPAEVVQVSDLLSETSDNVEFKPLSPNRSFDKPEEDEDYDPFDTSITSNLVPGKAELKLLESELIQ